MELYFKGTLKCVSSPRSHVHYLSGHIDYKFSSYTFSSNTTKAPNKTHDDEFSMIILKPCSQFHRTILWRPFLCTILEGAHMKWTYKISQCFVLVVVLFSRKVHTLAKYKPTNHLSPCFSAPKNSSLHDLCN